MRYAEILEIILMVAFGGYCGWTDLKTGIVRNRAVLAGLLFGLLPHGMIMLLGGLPFYPAWLVCMIIADLAALGMYMGEIWAAGDAKLFILLYYLFPPRLIEGANYAFSIIPFIYIFVPALIWLMADSTIHLIKREPRKVTKITARDLATRYITILIETTAFLSLMLVLFPQVGISQPILPMMLVLAYSIICTRIRIMRTKLILGGHLLVLLVLWILKLWEPAFPSWENILLLLLVILTQRYCGLYDYTRIPTSNVKEGMILSAENVIRFKKSRVHGLPQNFSEQLSSRITSVEAEAVRRWEKSVNGEPFIWIVRKVPFAMMISLGFVLWLLSRIYGR